jgi:hypothetical protein
MRPVAYAPLVVPAALGGLLAFGETFLYLSLKHN